MGLVVVFFVLWDSKRPEHKEVGDPIAPIGTPARDEGMAKVEDNQLKGSFQDEKYTLDEYVLYQIKKIYASLREPEYKGTKVKRAINFIAAGCVQVPAARLYVQENGLTSDSPKVREVSLIALGATMREDVVDSIMAVVEDDPDDEVRRVAVAALCQARSEEEAKIGFVALDLGDNLGLAAPYCSKAWEGLFAAWVVERSEKIKKQILALLEIGVPDDESDGILSVAFNTAYPVSLRKAVVYGSSRINESHAEKLAGIVADADSDLALRTACIKRLDNLLLSNESLKSLAVTLANDADPFMLRYLCGRQILKMGPGKIKETYGSLGGGEQSHIRAVDAMLWLVSKDPDEKWALKALDVISILGDSKVAGRLEEILQVRKSSSAFNLKVQELIEKLNQPG